MALNHSSTASNSGFYVDREKRASTVPTTCPMYNKSEWGFRWMVLTKSVSKINYKCCQTIELEYLLK